MTKRRARKKQQPDVKPQGASWAPPSPQMVSVAHYVAVRQRPAYLQALAPSDERRTLDEWSVWEQGILAQPA